MKRKLLPLTLLVAALMLGTNSCKKDKADDESSTFEQPQVDTKHIVTINGEDVEIQHGEKFKLPEKEEQYAKVIYKIGDKEYEAGSEVQITESTSIDRINYFSITINKENYEVKSGDSFKLPEKEEKYARVVYSTGESEYEAGSEIIISENTIFDRTNYFSLTLNGESKLYVENTEITFPEIKEKDDLFTFAFVEDEFKKYDSNEKINISKNITADTKKIYEINLPDDLKGFSVVFDDNKIALPKSNVKVEYCYVINYDQPHGMSDIIEVTPKTNIATYLGKNIKIPNTDLSLNMIWVEHGSFIMGTNDEDPALRNSYPAHKVTLTHDYYVSQTNISIAAYKAIMPEHKIGFNTKDDRQHPICRIYTWDNGIEFGYRLSELTGYTDSLTFRLATEAEWEYAAIGGNKADGKLLRSEAYIINCYIGQTRNQLGIYGMLGGLWEAVLESYYDYTSEDQVDPIGPININELNNTIWGHRFHIDKTSIYERDNIYKDFSIQGLRIVLSYPINGIPRPYKPI